MFVFHRCGSRVVWVSLLSECLMELSNCLQLHTSKRFIFLLVGRQDNLPDNFGKCSLGCPHVLENALALLNCMDAFSPLFTPHRTSCSKTSCQAYLWKGFTYFNKKRKTVQWFGIKINMIDFLGTKMDIQASGQVHLNSWMSLNKEVLGSNGRSLRVQV